MRTRIELVTDGQVRTATRWAGGLWLATTLVMLRSERASAILRKLGTYMSTYGVFAALLAEGRRTRHAPVGRR